MGLDTAERVSLIIRCDNPDCGQGIEKLLAWLVTVSCIACPYCGGSINLESGDNGLHIQKLAQACASIDASLSEPGKS
jgi:hypothetical protein